MSLVNPLTDVQKYEPLKGRMFWGRVIDNRDPKMLARIKIQILNTLPFENSNQLPWFYPKFPIGIGQGPLSGNQSIPEIDSYVIIEFPSNSIYFGFYTGTFSDRLRRLPDLLSEYPERYGWVDSRENKFIVNKSPRVDSVEHRFADGTLTLHDSRESLNIYRDKYGTQIYIDRKNQYITAEFANVKLIIKEGRINIEAIEIHFEIKRLFRVACREVVNIVGKKAFSIVSKVLGLMVKRLHTPDENQANTLPKHDKKGDLG